MRWKNFGIFICLLTLISGYQIAGAQQDLAQQDLAQEAYTIFNQHCIDCHTNDYGRNALLFQYDELIKKVVRPGDLDGSELYNRLIDTNEATRMPREADKLSQKEIDTIRNWIIEGAPPWKVPAEPDRFITTEAMVKAIHAHIESLEDFNRPYARYFTLTHLYNAGATEEELRLYRIALSKLINSLSWEKVVVIPKPIDPEKTIYSIDLRYYKWEAEDAKDKWYQIEQAYPYAVDFETSTYTTLRQETQCEVPYIHADWFIANASRPPLYHDILGLPGTDRELEAYLEVNVDENIQKAPGLRVSRAGFNISGVTSSNRVVERHESQYGAYWKTYDFLNSKGKKHVLSHPLDFEHDGGEIIFNLPNGLQAYYLSNASGDRLDSAPTAIASVPNAKPPDVINGIACMGCHTEGMRPFTDEVRTAIERNLNENPPYDKDQALRLYTKKEVMDDRREKDAERYKQAIEAAGGVIGDEEPVQYVYDHFNGLLDARHAAAAVGLERDDFLKIIRENGELQDLGLGGLDITGVLRETWDEQFSEIIAALGFHTDDFRISAVQDNGFTERSARSVAFSPASGILASGGDDGTIQLSDADTGKHLSTLAGHKDYVDILAFSRDGHTLVSVATQENTLNVWDVSTGDRIKTNTWNNNEPLRNIASDAESRLLAASGYAVGGGFHLWEVRTDAHRVKHLKFFSGHGAPVSVIAFSSQGNRLVSGNRRDKALHLWDAATGELLGNFIGHDSAILSVAFSPDGQLLASGSDKEIRLWNVHTSEHIRTFVPYTSNISRVSFSVDGRILAGGSDGEIVLWDVTTGNELKRLPVEGSVSGIDFSPDGRRLASAAGGSFYLWDITLSTTSVPQTPQLADVNGDGSVDVQDLVLVASKFGKTGDNAADVNKDGVINITDLVFVAGALSDATAAPSLWSAHSGATLTRTEVQQWLSEAEQLDLTDPTTQRGIRFLQQLLVALTPKVTTLLPNYPNPFNPETWIPYQLAKPADVMLTIYAIDGQVIRWLELGHQAAGIYQNRSRAAYWDGKNELGEPVASGVYFYTLTAGEFTATRKMLIRK